MAEHNIYKSFHFILSIFRLLFPRSFSPAIAHFVPARLVRSAYNRKPQKRMLLKPGRIHVKMYNENAQRAQISIEIERGY